MYLAFGEAVQGGPQHPVGEESVAFVVEVVGVGQEVGRVIGEELALGVDVGEPAHGKTGTGGK